MQFNWNIHLWAKHEIPIEVRSEENIKWIHALLKPVVNLYNELISYRAATLKKMRYNGQVIILEHLLNDLFDPVDRDIVIVTVTDTLVPPYVYKKNENQPLHVFKKQEYTDALNLDTGTGNVIPINHLNLLSELQWNYDFIVQARPASLTAEQIVQLKATVKYYKLAGKKPYYKYSNNQPF